MTLPKKTMFILGLCCLGIWLRAAAIDVLGAAPRTDEIEGNWVAFLEQRYLVANNEKSLKQWGGVW